MYFRWWIGQHSIINWKVETTYSTRDAATHASYANGKKGNYDAQEYNRSMQTPL